ncbi:MAG: MvaI/BcnI family restriction endonuclease [Treponema sp.]|nr:MvaI/BcnI family restriction endonuclease [Treponema sp.]
MTIEKFKEEFQKIKDMGYIPSRRRGPTGIGYTLETLLGIAENNDASPDIDGAELKAHRSDSNNLIT